MTITFHFAWWHIPLALTVVGLTWANWPRSSESGFGAAIGGGFRIAAVMTLASIAWAIAGILK